jgi:hypothetical protein
MSARSPAAFLQALGVSPEAGCYVKAARMTIGRRFSKLAGSLSPVVEAVAVPEHGEAPITLRPRWLHGRRSGNARRSARALQSDLRGPDLTRAARGPRFHKSMTTSRIGCEQQTRTLPSAGLSSGSGP